MTAARAGIILHLEHGNRWPAHICADDLALDPVDKFDLRRMIRA